MSFKCTTPRARLSSATTSGVAPEFATRSIASSNLRRNRPPASFTYLIIASGAPLRILRPSKSTPDMRVVAENGINVAAAAPSSRARNPYFSLASTTMDRPSGVSSASDANCAASASSASVTPGAGMNSVAWRLPNVIVPVLSSSSVSTSPAASTARPDIASTFCCSTRSIPAIPIAESNPPMVVGIKHTSKATSTKIDCGAPE